MAGELVNSVNFLAPVQEQIQRVEMLMRSQANACHPDLDAALQHLLSSGGKRVRPAVALLTGEMLGGDENRLVTLAAAIEMLHTATLVHDDLIDGAFLRRGIATLNSQWSPAATVLTGDFIFARAAKLAAETDHLALMKLFADTLATIVNGELTQLFQARGLASRENYYRRIYAKTASLIEMTTRASAMISPADEATVEVMRAFGYELGLAFQMVDDVLDFTGQQADVGKPVGSDLLQGLVTLPTLYFIESHPENEDVRVLLEGDYAAEPARMGRLVDSIRGSEAVGQALEEARQSIERALAHLNGMPAGTERDALQSLARYIVDRNL